MIVDALMGLVRGGPSARSIENPAIPLDSLADEWADGEPTWTGVRVSRKTALTISALWRGVNLISRDLAKMPMHVYLRTGEGESARERAREHPAYRLVRRNPNSELTAFIFWQTLMGHALFEGNGYAYIFRRGDGSPEELIPLLPDRTAPLRVAGQLWYQTLVGGTLRTLPARDVLHVRGYSYDGLLGYNVIDLAKQSIGWQVGMRKYGAKFFNNGSRASGVLMTPGRMKEGAAQNLLKSFERENAGLDKVGRTILLEEGAKYIPITITQEEAQFLESMEFGLLDVANWLNLAPHKVGHPGRTSYNSLEAENQSHLDEAIDPWAVNIEQECDAKLLTEAEKKSEEVFCEFNRNALIRVDYKTKQDGIRLRIESGQLSPDEGRALNNEGPRADGLGVKYWMPANFQYADQAAQPQPKAPGEPAADPPADPPQDPPADDGGDRQRLDAALRGVLVQASTRAVTWLANKTRNAARSPAKFGQWLDGLREAQAGVAAEIGPAVLAAAVGRRCDPRKLAETAAERLVEEFEAELLELSGRVTKEKLQGTTEAWLAAWESTAAERLASEIWETR